MLCWQREGVHQRALEEAVENSGALPTLSGDLSQELKSLRSAIKANQRILANLDWQSTN